LYNTLVDITRSGNVHVSFAECTDNAEDMEYLDAWDGCIKNFDNTDDYREELQRVKMVQGMQFKFDYTDYVIKILLATFVRWYFNLDQVKVYDPRNNSVNPGYGNNYQQQQAYPSVQKLYAPPVQPSIPYSSLQQSQGQQQYNMAGPQIQQYNANVPQVQQYNMQSIPQGQPYNMQTIPYSSLQQSQGQQQYNMASPQMQQYNTNVPQTTVTQVQPYTTTTVVQQTSSVYYPQSTPTTPRTTTTSTPTSPRPKSLSTSQTVEPEKKSSCVIS
jgi:hypothetical protein